MVGATSEKTEPTTYQSTQPRSWSETDAPTSFDGRRQEVSPHRATRATFLATSDQGLVREELVLNGAVLGARSATGYVNEGVSRPRRFQVHEHDLHGVGT
jgi:hypothetical protein